MTNDIETATTVHTITEVRHLSPRAYVVQFEKNELEFLAGQYVNLGFTTDQERREYSIYTSPNDDLAEVLIKTFPGGHVSSRLGDFKAGDKVAVDGVAGSFTVDEEDANSRKFYFVGTSTGISPFRSFIETYPQMDYHILHGIQAAEDQFEKQRYGNHYTPCVSRGEFDGFQGRVTAYLEKHPPDPSCLFYLCGNVDMIYDVIAFLQDMGVSRDSMATEVYF